MRIFVLSLCVMVLALTSGCGGGQPQAEPTWETHTTAEDEGGDDQGGEDEGGDDQGGEEAAPEDDPASP